MSSSNNKKKRKPVPIVLPASKITEPVQTQTVLKVEIIRETSDFRMNWHWLPSGKAETFTGLNTDDVLDSIYQQLMQIDGISAEKPQLEKSLPDLIPPAEPHLTPAIESAPEKPAAPKIQRSKILKELQVYQRHPQFMPGNDLQPYIPFTVGLQVHLPIIPTRENIDIDTPGFGIRLLLSGSRLEKSLVREFTEDIRLGVRDYSNSYIMPQLNPGDYLLAAWVTVPFAKAREKHAVSFRVQEAGSKNFD